MTEVKKIPKESSLLLDLIRGSSAQLVVIGHLLSFYHVQQNNNLPIIQNFGVLVFFILSGFLISQTSLIKGRDYGFNKYLIDRFSRIFYSFIPALTLVVLLDSIMANYGTYDIKYNNTTSNFFGNLFMLQGYPFSRLIGVEAFGSARPFWTVSVEWWIYICFGFVFYFFDKKSNNYVRWILFLLSVPLVFYYINYRGGGLSIVWLIGFVLAVIFNKVDLILSKKIFAILLSVASIGIIFRTVYIRDMYDIGIAFFFSIIVFSVLYLPNNIKQIINGTRISGFCRFIASYSYSLYLIHYTLIELYLSFFKGRNMTHFVSVFLFCNIVSYVFYFFFEKNNHWLKNKLRTHL